MGGGGAPCGACKFLRRKCVKGCIFAPYFCTEDLGAAHFGAIHKVFGASNFSKLLMHIPVEERYDAVVSVSYEAQARLHDPIYGCVSHIFALQHQVASLQAKLNVAHAQLANTNSAEAGPSANAAAISCSSTTGRAYENQQYLPPNSISSYGGAIAGANRACDNMDYSSSASTTTTADIFGQETVADEGDLQAFALALLRRGSGR